MELPHRNLRRKSIPNLRFQVSLRCVGMVSRLEPTCYHNYLSLGLLVCAQMNDSLRIRLGAVTLALLTLAAMIFAALNFQQRTRFASVPTTASHGWTSPRRRRPSMLSLTLPPRKPESTKATSSNLSVTCLFIAPRMSRAVLFQAAPWAEIRYQIRRDDASFRNSRNHRPAGESLLD